MVREPGEKKGGNGISKVAERGRGVNQEKLRRKFTKLNNILPKI